MNENPYQAPKAVLAVAEKTKSLEDNLRQYRQSRRRWSLGCRLGARFLYQVVSGAQGPAP